MARKLNPVMKAWLKHGHGCRVSLRIKPFKKMSAAQKKALKSCVMKKARMTLVSALSK